ncbi:MAG: hypothetical protein RIB59_15895, partial [Rhodospirillales bacterium]
MSPESYRSQRAFPDCRAFFIAPLFHPFQIADAQHHFGDNLQIAQEIASLPELVGLVRHAFFAGHAMAAIKESGIRLNKTIRLMIET